jgi:small nuclear ribonucleoprotein (snRNP)-like protein
MQCSHCGNKVLKGYDLCYNCYMEYVKEVKQGRKDFIKNQGGN